MGTSHNCRAEGKHREGRSRELAVNSRSLGEVKASHRRREAGTFQAAQKRSRRSCNGNRTGTEIVRRVYRVTRRRTLGSQLWGV